MTRSPDEKAGDWFLSSLILAIWLAALFIYSGVSRAWRALAGTRSTRTERFHEPRGAAGRSGRPPRRAD